MKIKLMIAGAMFALLALTAHAQQLVLQHTDGTATEINLSEQPKLTFDGVQMMVTTTTLQLQFVLGDISGYRFKQTDAAGVRSVSNNGLGCESDYMTDMNGRRVPLTYRKPGLYIIEVNGKRVKCIKK